MDDLEQLVDVENLQGVWVAVRDWTLANVFVLGNLVQLIVVLLAFVVARFLGKRAARWLRGREPASNGLRRVFAVLASLAFPLVWLGLQWTGILLASAAQLPFHLLEIVASLLTAWLVIRLVSSFLRASAWTRLIAWVAWTIAALNILNLLDPTIEALDSIALEFGQLRISPYFVIKAMLALALLLWAATSLAGMLEARIGTSKSLSPSLKVLISKLLKFVLIALAIIIAIESTGIDLTALTVFSGAVGLGLGFGLQKVIANLVSGVILLMDKSIKPGDVIVVEETYGWVNSLGGRYVSVITRDGTEHLIPNETLITNRVENWTHSDSLVRLKINVGVHYGSDVRRAMALCIEAAKETDRVVDRPAPRCLLIAFGDSSVDLQLRIWIADPSNGITNVRSDVMLLIWDKFHEHGIEFPYPQRDLHLRTPTGLLESALRG